MEQLLPPGTPRATYVIRADPKRFVWGGGTGQLILRKIIKIVATRSHILRLMHQIRFRLGLRPSPPRNTL